MKKNSINDLAEKVVLLAQQHNKTISFAESCTGGLLAAAITSVAGSSQVFLGSLVVYSNQSKHELLKVSKQVLAQHGAVSSECVLQMAEQARQLMQVDCAVSVSGVAGPDGGSDEKPVGLVWLGFSHAKSLTSRKCNFIGNRKSVRKQTVVMVLQWLIEWLENN